MIVISNAASLAGVALIGSEYISPLIFGNNTTATINSLLAASAIIIFYLVNFSGFYFSVTLQNILMAIKILVLLIIIAGIFVPSAHVQTSAINIEGEASIAAVLLSLGAAIKGASFAYGGYQQTINFGGEVNDAKRTIPKSIFIGIAIIITLYLLVNYSYYKIIRFEDLKTSPGIATAVAEKLFGETGKLVCPIVLFIAVLGYVNVTLLSNPRVMFAMSEDKILPAPCGWRNNKGVYTVSLTIFAAISLLVLFFIDSFSKILSFTIFLDCLGMVTAGIALFYFSQTHATSR